MKMVPSFHSSFVVYVFLGDWRFTWSVVYGPSPCYHREKKSERERVLNRRLKWCRTETGGLIYFLGVFMCYACINNFSVHFCFCVVLLTWATINYIIPRQIHAHASICECSPPNNANVNEKKNTGKTRKKLHSRVSCKLCSLTATFVHFVVNFRAIFFRLSFSCFFFVVPFTSSVWVCAHIFSIYFI